MLDKPKVFISYSHTSEDHKLKVSALARRLLSDGIDVVLDQWELYPGHDKYDFMERISKDQTINKILIICDSGYQQKADNNEGGVGIEGQIIRPDVYHNSHEEKYIPILFEKSSKGLPCLPVFLRGRIYIDLTIKDFSIEYEKLVREIFENRRHRKPDIGKPPIYVLQEEVRDEDYQKGEFFVLGLDEAVRTNISADQPADSNFNFLELKTEIGAEIYRVTLGRNTPNYFKFGISTRNEGKDYAMDLNSRPGFELFLDQDGEYFLEETIIWLGLKKFNGSANTDIVLAFFSPHALQAWLYVLRKRNEDWEFIGDIKGQSLFILSEGYIFARIGSQGLGIYYILSDDGFFIEEKEF